MGPLRCGGCSAKIPSFTVSVESNISTSVNTDLVQSTGLLPNDVVARTFRSWSDPESHNHVAVASTSGGSKGDSFWTRGLLEEYHRTLGGSTLSVAQSASRSCHRSAVVGDDFIHSALKWEPHLNGAGVSDADDEEQNVEVEGERAHS